MKTYGVSGLALNLQTLKSCRDTLRTIDHIRLEADADLGEILSKVLASLKSPCEAFNADTSLVAFIDTLSRKLGSREADLRVSALLAQIEVILDGINNNLSKRHFMVLSEEEAFFYSNPDLFGESFKEKYPVRALREAFDAGNSYAASLYTACAYHCMRVAEYGLRKLARNSFLKVKLTQKKGKPHPIEYADWQKVIDAIRAKIVKLRQRPVGPKREAELQFFSSAADHCEYMKDIWRNELSHTRRIYSQSEALSVINRVKEFVIAVGEHHGSTPATDSVIRLLLQAKAEEKARTITLLASPSSETPSTD